MGPQLAGSEAIKAMTKAFKHKYPFIDVRVEEIAGLEVFVIRARGSCSSEQEKLLFCRLRFGKPIGLKNFLLQLFELGSIFLGEQGNLFPLR